MASMTTTEPAKPTDRLSPRHARFVAAYLEDFNATHAYIRAGYSPQSAAGNASRLLHRPEIAAAIADGKRRLTRALAIGPERMAREYARIAFANIDDFVDVDADGGVRIDLARADRAQRAGLVDLTVIEGTESRPRRVRIKLDKLRALDQLTKRLDLFGEKPAPEVSAEEQGRFREVVEGLQRVLRFERERRIELERQLGLAQAPPEPEPELKPEPEILEEPEAEPIVLRGLGPPDPPHLAAPILWRHVSGLHPNAKIISSGGRKPGDPPDSYEALKQWATASPPRRR